MSGKLWKIKAAQKLLNAKRTPDPRFLEVSLVCEKVFEIKSFERPEVIIQKMALPLLSELRLMKMKIKALSDSDTEEAWERSLEEIQRGIDDLGELSCKGIKVL